MSETRATDVLGIDQEGSTARTESTRDASSREADFLVWSIEHTAWWRPDECGYTRDVEQAGRYTEARAREIARGPGPLHRDPPREKAIPVDGRFSRVARVNALVRDIASRGRRFFYRDGRVARLEIDGRGRLWWRDSYNERRIYTAYRGRWRGFTEGGTLRGLVECFCAYVKTGKQLPAGVFGPWPEWVCNGDLWAYGAENMAALRAFAEGLGMLAPEHPERVVVLAVDPSRSTPDEALAVAAVPPQEPQ